MPRALRSGFAPGLCVSSALASHLGSPYDLPARTTWRGLIPPIAEAWGSPTPEPLAAGRRRPCPALRGAADLGARWATGRARAGTPARGEPVLPRLGPESPDGVKIRLLHSLAGGGRQVFQVPKPRGAQLRDTDGSCRPSVKCGQWPLRLRAG